MQLTASDAETFMRMAEAFFNIPCLPKFSKSTKEERDLVYKIYESFHPTTETREIRQIIWQAAEEAMEAESHD